MNRIAAALVLLAASAAPLAAQRERTEPLQRLQADIERTIASVDADWGIYVKSLETGEEIAVDADRPMDTMSTIKIPLMVEVFQQVRDGRLSLDGRYTLTEAHVLPGTGLLRRLDPGAEISVRDLVTLMIVVSDNTATDVLYRMVGGVEAVNRRMEALGLRHTRAPAPSRAWFEALQAAPSRDQFHRDAEHPFGISTAREMGMLLERMERGTLVDSASSAAMLQVMRGQLYRTRIPRYVTGYSIPHKTGDFLPYIADDVGVLEAPGRTIVLTVFTANHFGSGEALEDAIGVVAKHVADYFAYRP